MFVGREENLKDLSNLWNKQVSSLVTCRGRRRIGKSSLIERFAANSKCRFIEIAGAAIRPQMKNRDQLNHFCNQLADQSNLPKGVTADSWLAAFGLLDSVISDDERTVVLLDEVSWMGRFDADFAGALKTVWDKRLKKHDRLICVICGSVSTWIQHNILENSAFAGRLSLNLVLDELPLRDCVKFLGRKCERLRTDEFFNVLSVTGGVPKYLEEIDVSVSADENIRRMCFVPTGALVDEFEQIFSEVFEVSAGAKKQLLHALAGGPLTATEIASRLQIDRNGHLTRHLDELEAAGFIAKESGLNPATGAPLKCVTYRIRDSYTRFYLHHMEPRMTAIKAGTFQFVSLDRLAGWRTILGLQFENLIVGHYREVLPFLNLGQALILSAAPYRRMGADGVQIDLLLQMDTVLYVVEVKHQEHIGKEVIDEMRNRVAKIPRKGRKSVRVALVYDGDLDPAVAASGYFDALVSTEDLLVSHKTLPGVSMRAQTPHRVKR